MEQENNIKKLIKACEEGDIKEVEKLLEYNIEINAKDQRESQATALHWAAASGYLNIVDLLISMGADINALDAQDQTALDWASAHAQNAIVYRLRNEHELQRQNFELQDSKPKSKSHSDKSEMVNTNEKNICSFENLTISLSDRDPEKSNLQKSDSDYEIDVPGDNSCLFWAAALGYLLPIVHSNQNEFKQRYEQLFGEYELSQSIRIQSLIQGFNPVSENFEIFNDAQLNQLIREQFRRRVIEHMSIYKNQYEGFWTSEHQLEQTFEDYLSRMHNPCTWGGNLEVRAISQLLKCNIHLKPISGQDQYFQNGNDVKGVNNDSIIKLLHVNKDKNNPTSGNHYHFKIAKEILEHHLKESEKYNENYQAKENNKKIDEIVREINELSKKDPNLYTNLLIKHEQFDEINIIGNQIVEIIQQVIDEKLNNLGNIKQNMQGNGEENNPYILNTIDDWLYAMSILKIDKTTEENFIYYKIGGQLIKISSCDRYSHVEAGEFLKEVTDITENLLNNLFESTNLSSLKNNYLKNGFNDLTLENIVVLAIFMIWFFDKKFAVKLEKPSYGELARIPIDMINFLDKMTKSISENLKNFSSYDALNNFENLMKNFDENSNQKINEAKNIIFNAGNSLPNFKDKINHFNEFIDKEINKNLCNLFKENDFSFKTILDNMPSELKENPRLAALFNEGLDGFIQHLIKTINDIKENRNYLFEPLINMIKNNIVEQMRAILINKCEKPDLPLPVTLAAWFISESSRYKPTFLANLLLFDLMESIEKCPDMNEYYSFYNALENPTDRSFVIDNQKYIYLGKTENKKYKESLKEYYESFSEDKLKDNINKKERLSILKNAIKQALLDEIKKLGYDEKNEIYEKYKKIEGDKYIGKSLEMIKDDIAKKFKDTDLPSRIDSVFKTAIKNAFVNKLVSSFMSQYKIMGEIEFLIKGYHPMVHGGSYKEVEKKEKNLKANFIGDQKLASLALQWIGLVLKKYGFEIRLDKKYTEEVKNELKLNIIDELIKPILQLRLMTFDNLDSLNAKLEPIIESFCKKNNIVLVNNQTRHNIKTDTSQNTSKQIHDEEKVDFKKKGTPSQFFQKMKTVSTRSSKKVSKLIEKPDFSDKLRFEGEIDKQKEADQIVQELNTITQQSGWKYNHKFGFYISVDNTEIKQNIVGFLKINNISFLANEKSPKRIQIKNLKLNQIQNIDHQFNNKLINH